RPPLFRDMRLASPATTTEVPMASLPRMPWAPRRDDGLGIDAYRIRRIGRRRQRIRRDAPGAIVALGLLRLALARRRDLVAAVAWHVLVVRKEEAARAGADHGRRTDGVRIAHRRLVEAELHLDHAERGVDAERIDEHRHVGPAGHRERRAAVGIGARR